MLAYKTVSGTKSFRKIVHLTMQSMAFCLSTIGVWAAYKFHSEKGVDHFYTLHSWLGLTCLFLFGTQVCALSLSPPSLLCFWIASWVMLDQLYIVAQPFVHIACLGRLSSAFFLFFLLSVKNPGHNFFFFNLWFCLSLYSGLLAFTRFGILVVQ
jgi:predicted ferric reductase